MNREEALKLVKEYLKEEKHLKHVLAVEAIMRGLAEYLNEDVEKWGLVGLLHDLDFELVGKDLNEHTKKTAEILKGKVSEEIIHAIMAHNEKSGVQAQNKMEYALRAADAASGLIIATALVMPHKKLTEVKVKSIKKKFKSKDFARNVSRERIRECEKLGLELTKFFEIALKALQGVASKLGL